MMIDDDCDDDDDNDADNGLVRRRTNRLFFPNSWSTVCLYISDKANNLCRICRPQTFQQLSVFECQYVTPNHIDTFVESETIADLTAWRSTILVHHQ